MLKKYIVRLALFLLLISAFLPEQSAEASAPIKGTFVGVSYEEVQIDKNTTEKRLRDITIENSQGRTITLTIDKYAKLSVDGRIVKIEAFKSGMEVEADVNLRRVKALRGISHDVSPGTINDRDKTVYGYVTQLDRGGKFLTIKMDDGKDKTSFITNETTFFQGKTYRDSSIVYEGDRVKLSYSQYNTNRIDSVEVIEQGVKVEGLFKGTILRIDQSNHKLSLKDEKVFENWHWRANTYNSTSSYTYSTKTPIYVGNEKISPDRLRYYAGNEVHFVTVKKFGVNTIEKMVIQKENERTFNEEMASVNTKRKEIGLRSSGTFTYHDGTILIRNGRLVEPASLQAAGTAFVLTDGLTKSRYASVIHIANDGFRSPNLNGYEVYFGKISSVSTYGLTLADSSELFDGNWTYSSSNSFTFSNDTIAVEDRYNYVLDIIPQRDLTLYKYMNRYGYFYVKEGHIVAMHLLDGTKSSYYYKAADLVSVGRLSTVDASSPALISVENVSRWSGGSWNEAGKIYRMDIEQATIIRNGKVISAKELKPNDRLYIVHESSVKGRFLFVD